MLPVGGGGVAVVDGVCVGGGGGCRYEGKMYIKVVDVIQEKVFNIFLLPNKKE